MADAQQLLALSLMPGADDPSDLADVSRPFNHL